MEIKRSREKHRVKGGAEATPKGYNRIQNSGVLFKSKLTSFEQRCDTRFAFDG